MKRTVGQGIVSQWITKKSFQLASYYTSSTLLGNKKCNFPPYFASRPSSHVSGSQSQLVNTKRYAPLTDSPNPLLFFISPPSPLFTNRIHMHTPTNPPVDPENLVPPLKDKSLHNRGPLGPDHIHPSDHRSTAWVEGTECYQYRHKIQDRRKYPAHI